MSWYMLMILGVHITRASEEGGHLDERIISIFFRHFGMLMKIVRRIMSKIHTLCIIRKREEGKETGDGDREKRRCDCERDFDWIEYFDSIIWGIERVCCAVICDAM